MKRRDSDESTTGLIQYQGKEDLRCPECKSVLRYHDVPSSEEDCGSPGVGDFAICGHCRTLLRYTEIGVEALSDDQAPDYLNLEEVRAQALEIAERFDGKSS